VVRAASDPERLTGVVRKEVLSLDKELSVYRDATLEQLLSASVASRRFNMLLLQVFAVVALALAVIGIYGLLSYSVSRRTHEIGIRMAVGARGGDIVKLIIRQALPLVAAGVAIGLIGAYALTRFMSSLLFEALPKKS
jgi:putative ABC transport system permease protein